MNASCVLAYAWITEMTGLDARMVCVLECVCVVGACLGWKLDKYSDRIYYPPGYDVV